MHTSLLLEMAAGAFPDRVATGSIAGGVTFGELAARSRAGGVWLGELDAVTMVFVGLNGAACRRRCSPAPRSAAHSRR